MLDDRLATDADAGSHKMLQVMVEESVALKYHRRRVNEARIKYVEKEIERNNATAKQGRLG